MFEWATLENDAFIIAEVGQNHQGDLDLALQYIKNFAERGADAIKFQTRNNKSLFSKTAYEAPYTSENAFAESYGKHREILELKPEWLPILKKECQKYGVKFMSTAFDEPSLDLLSSVDVDILKIASFDLGNLPFINKICKVGKPIALSIGGGNSDQIKSSVDLIDSYKIPLAILHCVSEYPCEYDRLGLSNIPALIEEFPSNTIGLSDHFNGILSGPIAYLLGARVFEKHVTLNRAWKGTDHSFALEPEGFGKFARDIRRVPKMLPIKSKETIGAEPVFKKLGKSIVASRKLFAGELITIDSLSGIIFESNYIPVRECNKVIGRRVVCDIEAGQPITMNQLVIE